MLSSLPTPWWQDPGLLAIFAIAGTLFGLVSVIGVVVATVALGGQQRLEHAYKEAMSQLEREGKGDPDIESRKTKLTELMDQIRQVPGQAQRVFLQEQLNAVDQSIVDLYSQHLSISDRLGMAAQTTALSSELAAEIERDILPPYLLRRRRRRVLSVLAGIVLVALLISPFTDIPIIRYSLYSFGLSFSTIVVFQATAIYIPVVGGLVGLLLLVPADWLPRAAWRRFVTLGVLAVVWLVLLVAALVMPLSPFDVFVTILSGVVLAFVGRAIVALFGV